MSGWIGVDLDGTLAKHDGGEFQFSHIGEPIPAMVKRVQGWIRQGYEVRIITARAAHVEAHRDTTDKYSELHKTVIVPIKEWCVRHIGMELPVTAHKDFSMIELWDDRAVSVGTNTGMGIRMGTHGDVKIFGVDE